MKLPATEDRKARRRDGRWRRIVRRTFYAKLGIAFGVLLVAVACYLRLVAGPVSLEDYSERVAGALADRIGPGWRVALADTAIELQGAMPAVRTAGLEVRNPAGQLVMRAPHAVVSLDPRSLLVGAFAPREIELRDLQLVAQIAADGGLSSWRLGRRPETRLQHRPSVRPPYRASPSRLPPMTRHPRCRVRSPRCSNLSSGPRASLARSTERRSPTRG
jgi:hypothetical protein